MGSTTDKLNDILKETGPGRIKDFFKDNKDALIKSDRPFYDYMRELIVSKGLKLEEVYRAADMTESFGYKILSTERHTQQRDLIIRLCLASRLTFEETQQALKLYGMSSLYARTPRDAIIISAINRKMYECADVNDYLEANGFKKLYSSLHRDNRKRDSH